MNNSNHATTVRSALQHASSALTAVSEQPLQEARYLLSLVLEKPPSWLLAWPDEELDESHWRHFNKLVERRQSGEPLAYLAGRCEFWSLDLQVTSATLIPRPDTEVLVETALDLLGEKHQARVLDLGTGSGAIALAIASERPDLYILASDKSAAALEVARINRDTGNYPNVQLLQSDWFDDVPAGHFDLIVSNPPYIRSDDEHLQDRGLQYEPESALISGRSGLDDITNIIASCREWLERDGAIALEHGYDQGAAVRHLFKQYGFKHVGTRRDYAGHERVTFASGFL